jgi:hypothetical protein
MQGMKMTYKLLLMGLLSGMSLFSLFAQSPFDPVYAEKAGNVVDQVQLFTDRSIYTVNESIHFMAEVRVQGGAEPDSWSSMLYVELVSADGNAMVHEKCRITGGRVSASIHIPSGALTGDYLLKAYTRWMRNRDADSFSYTPLKIINPFRNELSASSAGKTVQTTPGRVPYREGILACSTSSSEYLAGDDIQIKLSVEEQLMRQTMVCCVTVVPEGAIDLSEGQYQEGDRKNRQEPFRVSYLPDMGDGLSLSGSVVDSDQQPVPYTTLHFSLLGAHPDYYAAISNENGIFNLSSTWGEGKQEFFVTPEQYEARDLEIRIDQEFDGRPGLSLSGEFSLSEEEIELARKLTLNMQLSNAYRTVETSGVKIEQVDDRYRGKEIPFYGTRVKHLMIDDYVRLPNLEEIFINLVPEVQFYKRKGKTGIRIMSENNSIGVYKPLIMIDNITVFDEEALLALSPEKVERIDLINDIYLKGSVAFGGVLAIYSRKGDMAGIDLPAGSYFFDLQGIYQDAQETELSPLPGSRIPDTRNTIYWNDEVLVDRENPVEIPFRAPATPGNYVILVRALSPDGEILSASSRFMVE